ncbi:hypothetical protein B0J12DRAFT_191074 [Macrophomina phaseolina]|uniref:Polyketide cyclase/dehydrase n=1 Tax=Macrophomina phaseolina TaxID=35725 RepID=A0ABQ8G685_9PEZI|nr:hypothetical protein B0J12DRAFT_191074 [Macrophomina phaseolina]
MVTINVAYTAPINPAGATPVLTVDWSSLAHKIHNPSSFVPVIASTRVISESTEDSIPVVTREVTFKEGFRQQGATVQEVCKSYEPTRVDFYQPDGSRISNIVSTAGDGQLYLTYDFSWQVADDVERGSEKEARLRKEREEAAKSAVEKSVEVMRAMAGKEGGS